MGTSRSVAVRAWTAVRREPFRLLFPLGAILGGIGVGHWITYARTFGEYPGMAHATVQVQAFLMAFGAGFLLTMLQRRAGGRLAPTATVLGIAIAFVLVTAFAFRGQATLAQAAYLGALLLLAERAIRLVGSAGAARPPAPFILVPIGLAQAAVGAVLLAAQPHVAAAWPGQVGRWLVGEGCWLCLALGVGHVIMPTLMGTQAPVHRGRGRAHAAVGLVIAASFVLQSALSAWSPSGAVTIGLGLRGLVVTWELAACMRLLRRPRVPGTHRTLAWLSFWMLPAGLLPAAAWPVHRVAFLHVAYVGGFSLMTFAVALHVIAAHGGFDALLGRRSWTMRAIGGLVLVAAATRLSAAFLPPAAYWSHLGFAAAAWIAALAAWTAFLLPKAVRPRGSEQEDLVQVTLPGR